MKSRLKRLCNQLPANKPIWDITAAEIGKLKANRKKKAEEEGGRQQFTEKPDRNELRILRRFFDFCITKTGASRSNPVEMYLDNLPKEGVNPQKIGNKVTKRHNLTMQEEIRLAEEIEKNLEDGRYMIFTLINSGLELEFVGKVKWADISFDPKDSEFVQIRQVRGRTTATHNYMHPVFPDAAKQYHARYALLKEAGFSDERLQSAPILTKKDKPLSALGKEHVTDFVRGVLLQIGISASCLKNNRNGMVGGGPMLLKRNYDYRLNQCGLQEESGMRCESEILTGLILSLRVPLVKLLPNTYRRSRIKSKF